MTSYCAVIRTLGKAGNKYQQLLDSLRNQTFKPSKIIVYLAEGFERPAETIGVEQIVYVPKGMVAQRALPYIEVDTEWMLMLDDDVAIEPDGVERLFKALEKYKADVIGCDLFPHHKLPLLTRIAMALLFTSIPRIGRRSIGYTVNCVGSDCYNPNPKDTAWSSTNAGPAMLCRKKDFLKIKFEDELWLDQSPYAIPEDKVMFYKMHLSGLKILTHYNSGFTHLDAGSAMTNDRQEKTAYSMGRNNHIFYQLYVWPNLPIWKKPIARLLQAYQKLAASIYYAIGGCRGYNLNAYRRQGLHDAKNFLKTYKNNGLSANIRDNGHL